MPEESRKRVEQAHENKNEKEIVMYLSRFVSLAHTHVKKVLMLGLASFSLLGVQASYAQCSGCPGAYTSFSCFDCDFGILRQGPVSDPCGCFWPGCPSSGNCIPYMRCSDFGYYVGNDLSVCAWALGTCVTSSGCVVTYPRACEVQLRGSFMGVGTSGLCPSRRWIGHSPTDPNGSWLDPQNWNGAVPPGPQDDVVFDLAATYTVTDVPVNAARSISFTSGTVGFVSLAPSVTLSGNVSVLGGSASFSVPLRVAGNVTITTGAQLAMSGQVNGSLSNAGGLRALRGDIGVLGLKGILMTGAFIQSATGTLRVEIAGPNPGDNSQIFLSGTHQSAFDGTLAIDRIGGFVPPAGEIYNAVYVQAAATAPIHAGRFSNYEGQAINNQIFFGVDQNGTGPIATGMGPNVELLVLKTPRRASRQGSGSIQTPSGRSHLVVIAHGWRADILSGGSADLRRIGENMAAFSSEHLQDRWDVAYMDWSEFNQTLRLPWAAGRRAHEIGESTWQWMADQNVLYQGVHALAHSAGSWLADSLVRGATAHLGANPQSCQITLLDAFTPPELIASYGEPGIAPIVGDHYIDLFDGTAISTSTSLRAFVNYDVTMRGGPQMCYVLAPWDIITCSITHHSWPMTWYADTVPRPGSPAVDIPCDSRTSRPGFERSRMFAMFRSGPPSVTGCTDPYRQRGQLYDATSDSLLPTDSTSVPAPGISSMNTSSGPTGTVTFPTDGAVQLRTGSPVEATTTLGLGGLATAIDIEVGFLSNASGLLTVYQGAEPIGAMLEEDARTNAASNGFALSGKIRLLQPVGPGPVSLTFRVDPGASGSSEVIVRSLRFFGPRCRADLDDGTGSGTPDGGVTIDDLLFFLQQFAAGDVGADLDDGSGSGSPDGGVTVEDLLFFLERFGAGC
jgi:hypothetical protein